MNAKTAEDYAARIARINADTYQRAKTGAADIAAALSAITGDPWTGQAREDYHQATIDIVRNRDQLRIYAVNRNAAWHVTATNTKHRTRDEATSANLSVGKTPAQLASDIRRRILPIAETLAGRALAHDQKEADQSAWLERTAAALQAACPVPLTPTDNKPDSYTRTLANWGTPRLTIKLVSWDKTTRLDADDLQPETLAAMLAILSRA